MKCGEYKSLVVYPYQKGVDGVSPEGLDCPVIALGDR